MGINYNGILKRLFVNSHITHASFSTRMDFTKTGMGNGKLKWEIENGKFSRLIVDNADIS